MKLRTSLLLVLLAAGCDGNTPEDAGALQCENLSDRIPVEAGDCTFEGLEVKCLAFDWEADWIGYGFNGTVDTCFGQHTYRDDHLVVDCMWKDRELGHACGNFRGSTECPTHDSRPDDHPKWECVDGCCVPPLVDAGLQ